LNDIALPDKSSQSYEVSLAIWDHSITFHPTQENSPRLTSASHAGTRFTYPRGIEGWVDDDYDVYVCV